MINPIHLRQLIVDPVLKYLEMYSPAASNLLMGTAAQESRLGYFLMQVDAHNRPQGPALGIFQMEPTTHDDIWETYLNRPDKSELSTRMRTEFSYIPDPERMIWDMKYATAMARLKYWRDPEPLPQAGDIEGLAHIYKRVFNSPQGKATVQEFVDNYERYVGDPL